MIRIPFFESVEKDSHLLIALNGQIWSDVYPYLYSLLGKKFVLNGLMTSIGQRDHTNNRKERRTDKARQAKRMKENNPTRHFWKYSGFRLIGIGFCGQKCPD